MRTSAQMTFGAIFQNEVRLNSKRVVPYVLMVLFSANAVLWSVAGAAVSQGWATNSDFYIVRNFAGFCFITGLPLFAAVIMGDPVIRDFKLGVDPLIFSKPISRASYLLGKFFGNFFVLVCCQAAFALTLILLQVFHTSEMIVLPVRVLPYFKHFFFFVVISYLIFAAVYFTIGTLTRNTKFVYAAAVFFYPFYIAYQVILLKRLPEQWRTVLDPFTRVGIVNPWEHSADYLDHLVITYSSDMIANRALVVLISAVCLAILYFRFTITERPGKLENFSTLNLLTGTEKVYYDSDVFQPTRRAQIEDGKPRDKVRPSVVQLPEVTRANEGFNASFSKLVAALGVEFRLLCAERSLIVLVPLAIFFSTLELMFYEVALDVFYSATYAGNTAQSLLILLLGIAVFYTGEAMHRDRELRVEPILWSAPTSDSVILLSKLASTILLSIALATAVALTAIVLQIYKGHTPINPATYIVIYTVILIPNIIFIASASVALNAVLRDKYIAYAVSLAIGGGLFYLFGRGYNHWLYNPVLYQLWTPSDLTDRGGNLGQILIHRIYCLALAVLFLALGHLFFKRQSARGFKVGRGWTVLIAVISLVIAVIAGSLLVV